MFGLDFDGEGSSWNDDDATGEKEDGLESENWGGK